MSKLPGTDDHRKRIRLKWLKRRWSRGRDRSRRFGDSAMPISHKDLWVKIKRESKGRSHKDELALLESYLSDWPEFKGPYQELRKKLERRVAELRKIERVRASHGSTAQVSPEDPFSVRKRGLAEVALLGLPNTGKSTLFGFLTGADAAAADYPYTTLTPNVAMFTPGGFEFEIVDLPPFPEGSLDEINYAAGLKEAVLNADVGCAVIDLRSDWRLQLETLGRQLRSMGVAPPWGSDEDDGFDTDAALPAVIVATFADLSDEKELTALISGTEGVEVFAFPSGDTGGRAIAEALCRLKGRIVVDARDPETREEPLAYAVPIGATVSDLAGLIHRQLAASAVRARIWGPSASFDGQEVGLDHVLRAGDLVEILTR